MLAFVLARRRDALANTRALLMLACFAASVAGVLVFDVLQGTRAVEVQRYALPGLPAALLLAAFLIACLPDVWRWVAAGFLLVGWIPANAGMLSGPARRFDSLPLIATEIERGKSIGEIVLIGTIPPSAVLGVARYLPDAARVASWIPRLNPREPEEARDLVSRHCGIAYVHAYTTPSPLEPWLSPTRL